jgi:hypothetical protein
MQKEERKAWKILTKEERLALSLKYGHSKSTWESG